MYVYSWSGHKRVCTVHLWHSVTWPYTMTTPYWSDFVPNSTFYRILSGFHRTFATGVACRQGTLTPPDTWSRPFGTCICSTCWDQSFSELVVILPDYALRISLGTFSILLLIRLLIYTDWYLKIFNTGRFRYRMCVKKCYNSKWVKWARIQIMFSLSFQNYIHCKQNQNQNVLRVSLLSVCYWTHIYVHVTVSTVNPTWNNWWFYYNSYFVFNK